MGRTRGLTGVTIMLNGRRSLVTTTDEDGNYLFTKLPPGRYSVRQVNPGGYLSTTPGTVKVILIRNKTAAEVNFGDALPVSIFGTVFQDDDCDGQFAFFESGIGEVHVTVYDDADGEKLDSQKLAAGLALISETSHCPSTTRPGLLAKPD